MQVKRLHLNLCGRWQSVCRNTEDELMTIAQQLEQIGIEKGLQQGLQQGLQLGEQRGIEKGKYEATFKIGTNHAAERK